MSNIIYPAVVFYVVLITLAGLVGAIEADISFPEFPEVPEDILGDIPIISALAGVIIFIVSFGTFIALILNSLFQLITFTFTTVMPIWLSTILFLPLVITVAYETIARLVRGS